MHIRSLRWCVTGDFKGDSRIDSLICERRRDGVKARRSMLYREIERLEKRVNGYRLWPGHVGVKEGGSR